MKQPIKMTPGDDTHLSMLMAPCNLNFFVGKDRQDLLAYGRAAFEAGKAGQCLHQIQEPEADIWPCVNIDVDASGKITNAKLYSPGLPAGNHDVYPVRVPYMDEHTEAWRACVDELEKAVPGFMSLGNMNGIECAVAAIRGLSERAKHQELAAAEQAAWHAGLDEGLAQATGSVSNATSQAAPAAVAVPDFREAIRAALDGYTIDTGEIYFFEKAVSEVNEAVRAALAANLANGDSLEQLNGNNDLPAAAPVVLPEPTEFQCRVKPDWDDKHPWTDWEKCTPGAASDYLRNPTLHNWTYEVRKLYTEQQVRAMLAQAATPAAAIGNPISKQNQQVAEPVVLPEPVAFALEWTFDGEERGIRLYDDERHCRLDAESDGGVCSPLYTEQQVRALLATATGLTVRDAVVQWWLATIDQYGNPTLTDGAHRDRAGADQAAYLIDSMNLGGGKKYAVARVELSEPRPSAEGVNHEAIAQNNSLAIAAAKGE